LGDYFIYNHSKLHYYTFGTGAHPLVAIHGFGQNGLMFSPVKNSLGKRFTIFSFDFAYHGKTEWNEKHALTKSEFIRLLEEFMRQHHFKKISLLGFSMGGRVALSLIPDFAEKLEDVILIAPDGIEERIYYRSFMSGKTGEAAFRKILSYPKLLITAADAFTKLGLTKKYVADYMRNYWADERKREKLFNVWLSMRTYLANLDKIRFAAEKHSLRIFLLWGNHDKIIPAELAHRFKKRVPRCKLLMVDGGHFIVNEKLNEVLDEMLKND